MKRKREQKEKSDVERKNERNRWVRNKLIEIFTKYGLLNKSTEVNTMVAMEEWEGHEAELFTALNAKYQNLTAADYVPIYVKDRRAGIRRDEFSDEEEEDEASTDEQRAQLSYEERYSTPAWTRLLKHTREAKRMAMLPKCRMNGNLDGPSVGMQRAISTRERHIDEQGWHPRQAWRRSATAINAE